MHEPDYFLAMFWHVYMKVTARADETKEMFIYTQEKQESRINRKQKQRNMYTA
jgi:hypothetical protein